MRHRTVICVLWLVLPGALLACSLFTPGDEPDEALRPPSPFTGGPSTALTSAVPYFGEESIEERIAKADVIVKARLHTTTSVVVRGAGEGWSDYYYVALKFNLTVREYLNGSGANEITAFTIQGGNYDTRKEAEDAKPDIVGKRVTTWDDRDAILFLTKDDPDGAFSTEVQGASDYFLTIGGPGQDSYSLHSRHTRLWLPSTGIPATGDDQEFLLAVPEPGRDTPTITLGELKSVITTINSELNTGDGSDEYKECIRSKYQSERMERFRMSRPGYTGPSFEPIWGGTFASGQPAGLELYEYDHGLVIAVEPEKKTRLSIDGRDAGLFSITEGNHRPAKVFVNGKWFTYSIVSVRPIPAGTYEFNHHYGGFIDCGDNSTFMMTANVTAPTGTLHEAFFDPVTEGSAIAADSTNGVLKPAAFADANGASATIESISYEAGTVKLKISPHAGLAGQVLDFIELDGTVSLSLDVADATLDAVDDTLSWAVATQPWHNGDKLMLRIREAR